MVMRHPQIHTVEFILKLMSIGSHERRPYRVGNISNNAHNVAPVDDAWIGNQGRRIQYQWGPLYAINRYHETCLEVSARFVYTIGPNFTSRLYHCYRGPMTTHTTGVICPVQLDMLNTELCPDHMSFGCLEDNSKWQQMPENATVSIILRSAMSSTTGIAASAALAASTATTSHMNTAPNAICSMSSISRGLAGHWTRLTSTLISSSNGRKVKRKWELR